MTLFRTSPWRDAILAGLLALSLVACRKTVQAYPDEFVGVGIVLQTTPTGHVISRVIAGGPAASAGLQVGDQIRTINGEPVEGKTLPTVVDALRGKDGSAVVVGVHSTQGSDVTVTLTRQRLARNGTDYALH
jgi:carboxyl-terminal processing protease